MIAAVAAVDLGASSGRVVLGRVGPDVLQIEAVARFTNDPVLLLDGLHWNALELYARALEGLHLAWRKAGSALLGLAIDSWAVDYGLVRGASLLGMPFHYRDARTTLGVERVHGAVPHEELYRRNGLQFLTFNSLYQLAVDPWLHDAERMLLIPDLLSWWLTGEMVTERTNASTTGLLDARTGSWDHELARRLGIPSGLLTPLVEPGTTIGKLRPEVADPVGLPRLEVTTVGSHDTASAVVGVPIQTDHSAYISCGTWGLVGLELAAPVLTDESRAANFTNEGGVDGRVRFLTNVMGLWLLNESMRAWERAGVPERLDRILTQAASLPPSPHLFDVQDLRFQPPGDMPARIQGMYQEAGIEPPSSPAALVRAIIDSIAQAFADSVERAQLLSGQRVRTIHLVGGGALNALLCQETANRSGRVVLAGPVEATAIGNVLVQGRTVGALTGKLEDLRRLVAATHPPTPYRPTGKMVR
jgi:rhamnulokinase